METFHRNILFQGLTDKEIAEYIDLSQARIRHFEKEKVIFSQQEIPNMLYVLLKGSVLVCKNSMEGKRYIVSKIHAGDIFGEVFVFAGIPYDFYTIAHEKVELLEIPIDFLREGGGVSACEVQQKVLYNMLHILAKKAYKLNQRVQLLTSGTLRQKIIKLILEKSQDQTYVKLGMNREMMADFLNVTRPSLSREFTNMQRDGLIEFEQDIVKILDVVRMKEILAETL